MSRVPRARSRLIRPSAFVALAALAALVAFGLWYRGDREPVTDAEIEAFLGRVAALDAPAREFLERTDPRAFLAADDGRPFYVVNLFRLRERALPLPDSEVERSGVEAMAEFSRRVVPLFLRHGGHPVFATDLPSDASQRDLVTVVRYRSRRDWMAIATSDRFLEALPHRLAATDRNTRLALPGTLVPHPLLVVLGLCAPLAYAASRLRRPLA
jgi:hypothetical protein